VSEGAAKKEEKPRKFQAIRGTRDLLPPETALWNRVEQTAHEVFGTFGFGEIRLPIFESTDLFARAVGGDTDIVSKEMYTFRDTGVEELYDKLIEYRGSRPRDESAQRAEERFVATVFSDQGITQEEVQRRISEIGVGKAEEIIQTYSLMNKLGEELEVSVPISLRPEATASVCRAYIEHNMQQLPQPVKLYYMGPMFRRERPQKGRYRQFYQIGAEILGGPDAPAIDAELIEMVMAFFAKLGLQGTVLDINSIGHNSPECRPKYVKLLRARLLEVKDQLGADSQRRMETNPLRVLDSKLEHEQAIIQKLPHIADHICDDCKTHYAAVRRELDLRGVKYRENWRLVRGLDYYMRTTFEITAQGLGSQNAICGGGRYDGLVQLLGGRDTKGIGFAIGEDRLILSLTHSSRLAQRRDIDVVVAWMTPDAYHKAVELARRLRSEGVKVDLPVKFMRAGDAVGYANRIGAYFTLMLGKEELSSGELTLKHMVRQDQIKITESALIDYLKQRREMKEELGTK
jgi:histidyl-tRNA synthetase